MNVVTYIELHRAGDRLSGIRRIHGHANGAWWSLAEAEAIEMILSPGPTYTFWVIGSAQRVARVIVAGTWPHQYLKTEADGIYGNNLLALPEWPYAA